MKQISLGLLQYVQDYDERLPNFHGNGNTPFYHVKLQPYVKSEQIFRCPSVRQTTDAFSDNNYSTYGMIGRDDGGAPTGQPGAGNERHIYDWDGAHMSWVPAPVITYMLVETWETAASLKSNGRAYNHVAFGSIAFGSTLAGSTDGNRLNKDAHFEGYNAAFVDGHVKWVKLGTEQGYAVSLHSYCIASPDC